MQLFRLDACHPVGRREAPTTDAKVCLVIVASRLACAEAISPAYECVPMLNAINPLH